MKPTKTAIHNSGPTARVLSKHLGVHFRFWMVLASLGLVPGCGAKEPAEAPIRSAESLETRSAQANTAPEGDHEQFHGPYSLKVPANWESVANNSGVILAEFRVPEESGDVRVTLSTAGGGLDANLSRWEAQFRRGDGDPPPERTKETVGSLEITWIELQGTFTDVFRNEKRENHSLIGAVLPADENYHFYIKCTGPRDSILAIKEDFRRFVESARKRL